MNRYQELARGFLEEMERRKLLPPHPDDIRASMRGEMAVLRLLDHQKKRLTAGEISRRLDMTTPRIAAVLNSLEKKGMVERGGDAHDRRRVLVALTEKGNACCQAKKEAVQRRLAMVFEAIGPEDTEAFIRVMQRVSEAAARLREEHGAACEPGIENPVPEGGKAI